MSSKTHNKHIKLDTNLTKRSSDPDNDREISNEKIDIYELCIHPIRHSLTLYPYMYDLSRHHSHYDTSTFTQTYWKDHLIEITIERARAKRSRSEALYMTHPIHYSLTLYPYMYDISRHHSYYNTSTFTQTYWKNHLIEITIERARTKTSRSASSVYTQYITHSLSIHI